jgi:tetratricopeptide (TPR) repeat protein
MKRFNLIVSILLIVFAVQAFPADAEQYFAKGLAYYLLEDTKLAQKNFNHYFNQKPNPQVKGGFTLLVAGKDWDATNKFRYYLDISHRSPIALVGIALSTVKMTDSTTMENLDRAIRLEPRYAPAYLALGFQYYKQKNYPKAESNLRRAVALANVPEFKIILSKLYLEINRPLEVLNLMKGEADRDPENFYFNYLTAKAFLMMGQLQNLGNYIQTAQELNPTDKEVNVLLARYLLGKKEFTRARQIIGKVRYEEYNQEYVKTFAEILMALKDRRAKSYLYQAFSHDHWDKDINKLLGLYYLNNNERDKVQNCINRSIMSGNSPDELKEMFPQEFGFSTYNSLPFFAVHKIAWLSDKEFLAVANDRSGGVNKLFIIDAELNKIIQAITAPGEVQDLFVSPDRDRVVFSVPAIKNEKVNVYAMQRSGRNFSMFKLVNAQFPMAGIEVGFNRAGTMAYITDARIRSTAFESPFSVVSLLGKKNPVYPVYPFPVFRFNFANRSFGKLKDISQIERVPIKAMKKYFLVVRGYETISKIGDLIRKGEGMDVTSSEVVKIHFADDLSSFIIYLSDLKNAFQAIAFLAENNKIHQFDASIFLQEGRYAEVDILHFDHKKNELHLATRDKKRDLIRFNYKSKMFNIISSNLFDYFYNKDNQTIYMLTERTNKKFYSETDFEWVSLAPYTRGRINGNRDLKKLIDAGDITKFVMSTYTGQMLTMDSDNNFSYVGPSLDGALHKVSPSGKRVAVFINHRLLSLKL